jgi:non-structural maintenance of chromosomes element 4
VNRLICKLKSKLTGRLHANGSTYFDWRILGCEAGVCFNSLPSRVTFLLAPLENGSVPEKKVRVVRQKKSDMVEEKLVEQKPEEQAQREKMSVDQLSQAERDLKQMRKLLVKRAEANSADCKRKYDEIKSSHPELVKEAQQEYKERGLEIEFVPFLVNPKSFTQTVENIFNFSFLIKKGEALIDMRKATPLSDTQESVLGLDTSGCFIRPEPLNHEGPSKQCVLSFTMKDWRRLCDAYELEKCDIPHRKGSKQRKTSSQQSSQEEEDEVDE